MMGLKQHRLILFFTRGVSLRTWDELGMLEREVALYRQLQECGVQVIFVTYGETSDLAYVGRIPGIRILCNRWRLSADRYARLLPLLHAPYLWRASLFKTNQTSGAEIALRAARFHCKRLVARCGYLLSDFTTRQHGPGSPEAQWARNLEETVFTGADRVVVTTPSMRRSVIERYRLPQGKVTVIPNYVDPDLFKPNPNGSLKPGHICFIGRLEKQKNPFALLEAVRGLDVELLMIGNGGLRDDLAARAQAANIPAQFLGNLPNTALPQYLNSSQLFILPSLYEGHPKTLLEAMACGLPVIGTDVPGIREVIEHRQTGFLCGTSPGEIRAAIQEVLADSHLRDHMGQHAREYVCAHFSLDRILELELALLQQVAGQEGI